MPCTSKGKGTPHVTSTEGFVAGYPRLYSPDGNKRGTIIIRGAAGDHMSSFADVQDQAQWGPCIACDFGTTTGGRWGTDAALTRITEAWTLLKGTYGAKTDKVILSFGSGGGIDSFNWLRANTTSVAAITGAIPAISLTDIHDNNRGGFAADIEAKYTNLAGYNAVKAAKNPAGNLSEIAATNVPIKLWYSTDDPITLPGFVTSMAAAVPTCTLRSMGAVGHAVSGVASNELPDFLAPYR